MVALTALAALMTSSPQPTAAAPSSIAGDVVLTDATPLPCGGGSTSCPHFTLTCSAPNGDLGPITGGLGIGAPSLPQRGTIVIISGAEGKGFWAKVDTPRADAVKALRVAGFEVIQVRYDDAWNVGTKGLAALGCSAAALMEWAAARDAAAGSTPPDGVGVCGVCVLGFSIGSADVAGALAFFDVSPVVDAAVLAAGPPSTDIPAGCARDGSPLMYAEVADNPIRQRIDDSFDAADPSIGPCSADPEDLSMVASWEANSLTAGTLTFPTTRYSFVWGSKDALGAAGQGLRYLDLLYEAGNTLLGYACVPTAHDVTVRPVGLAAILSALMWTPDQGLNVPPAPLPTLRPRCPRT